jgi:NAD(P)-dependent dehydrogenase (short-subunit alcohol dehydrogenase family)
LIETDGHLIRGLYTTIELLKKGAKVYIFSRSKQKVEAAIKDIKEYQKNANVEFVECDLGDFNSVKKAADEFLKFVLPPLILIIGVSIRGITNASFRIETKLHILINNAGVCFFLFSRLFIFHTYLLNR